MTHRPELARNHVSSRETERLGLGLGRKIGLLDPTTKPVTDDRYARGEWDELHAQMTVVDAYSAAVDLEQLLQGGIDVVIQALGAEELFVRIPTHASSGPPPTGVRTWKHVFEGPDLVERIRINIEEHLAFVKAYEDHIGLARSEQDVKDIVKSGRIAMVLMLVSGVIAGDLRILRQYRDWGVTVMALCHLGAMDWSDSTAELNDPPGLTKFGREVVAECNAIGILIDLAHASDETCREALEVATRPVVATHTKCRAISNAMRDMSDDVIRAVADGGGVVGILAPAPRTSQEPQEARLRRDARLAETYPDPFELAAAKLADAYSWGTKLDLESIDHAVNIAGIDHVGISSHFQNVPQWREFTGALIEHGYSEENAAKILGENVLRVVREGIG